MRNNSTLIFFPVGLKSAIKWRLFCPNFGTALFKGTQYVNSNTAVSDCAGAVAGLKSRKAFFKVDIKFGWVHTRLSVFWQPSFSYDENESFHEQKLWEETCCKVFRLHSTRYRIDIIYSAIWWFESCPSWPPECISKVKLLLGRMKIAKLCVHCRTAMCSVHSRHTGGAQQHARPRHTQLHFLSDDFCLSSSFGSIVPGVENACIS